MHGMSVKKRDIIIIIIIFIFFLRATELRNR